jgi:5'(3')-deoxyribonucleotidase
MARIAVDMDGVTCDTYAAQCKWLAETHPDLLDLADGRKFRTFLSDMQWANFMSMMADGLFFNDLPPMYGAIEVMEKLCAEHDVFIVSAGTLIPKSCFYKYDWVVKYMPYFDIRNLVFCMNKGAVLADYLIDDHVQNFERFQGKGLLFGNDPNHLDYPDRVKDWADVAQYEF